MLKYNYLYDSKNYLCTYLDIVYLRYKLSENSFKLRCYEAYCRYVVDR